MVVDNVVDGGCADKVGSGGVESFEMGTMQVAHGSRVEQEGKEEKQG